MKNLLLAIFAALALTACTTNTTVSNSQDSKYRLYETKNMWTFLKLDTETGKVWQLQYALNNTDCGEVVLSDVELNKDGKLKKGRFELYPTENTFNFLLLDRETGAVYQIQWTFDTTDESRGIVNVISE